MPVFLEHSLGNASNLYVYVKTSLSQPIDNLKNQFCPQFGLPSWRTKS